VILEFDDDDDDYEEDTRTYDDFHDAFMKLQGSKKRRADVGDQAQAIFDEMFEAYIMSDDDPSLWPNTTIYNILLDTHAWSPAEDGADKAQHILDRMEDLTVEMIARPDVVSYMHVMEAWANRNEPEKSQSIMNRLLARYEVTANPDVRPDTKAYNKLIGAWMKSDAIDNAEQAEMVLQDMIGQYEATGDNFVLPNQKSFVQVMRCYGKRQTKAGLDKVRELFATMNTLYRTSGSSEVQPDTQVYNELINAFAQNTEIEGAAQQAEAILYEMMEASNMGNDALQPNAATFRQIIYGYKGVTDPGAAYKVEKLLELTRSVGVEVNAGLYNAAIQVISWTREPEKAALCWKLVQRMKTEGIEPTKTSFNNVLNACGHTFDPKDPKEIFRIAIEAFNELRDAQYMGPDVTSYGHFLRCCSELLPQNAKRDSVVKSIFLKCCNDGQVGRFVLAQLMEAGSEELVEELLGGRPEDGIKIPRKWSQNVKDTRQLLR
jgi:Pentatricopeptide repeat domain